MIKKVRKKHVLKRERVFTGAGAICVGIGTEMKKCPRVKDMLNFNVLVNFWPI